VAAATARRGATGGHGDAGAMLDAGPAGAITGAMRVLGRRQSL
jgi:hypothetical protein